MKKTSVIIATTLLFSCLLPVFASCKRGDKISDEMREQLSARTENAQFMPDAQTVMGENMQTIRSMQLSLAQTDNEAEETAFDVFDMERLLSELAVIDGNGAGKYLGYEVDEIKMEMYNMVNRAPWMNEWFRVPRADDGVDYFSNWAYLIENDLEYNFLSITRISWRTRASYYDSELGREVEDYDGGSVVQYNVMRTEYYMDEDTEIVEVEMLDVMQAHGEDHFMAYQGLKNAKDKYFIKYNIEAKPRTKLGYAIDTNTPYGANREFSYMSYENANFDLLQITQRYPNKYRSESFGEYPAGGEINTQSRRNGVYASHSLSYDYDADGVTPVHAKTEGANEAQTVTAIADFATKLGLPLTQTQSFTQSIEGGSALEIVAEDLLGALSKQLVDEHELANSWEDIFKDSDKAKKEIREEIDLPIKIKYSSVSVSQAQRGDLGDAEFWGVEELFSFDAKGYLVPNPAFRNITECNYYLAPALMNEKGEIIYLPNDTKGATNDFDEDWNVMWYGAFLETKRNRGNNALCVENFKDITMHGEYAVVAVLREKNKEGHLGNIYLVEPSYPDEFSFTVGQTAYRFYVKHNQFRLQISEKVGEGEKGL
ncbi:MAG: hypothetical protein E7381_03985 [Clostridiales bacterium]|nr:hypothetical protein [Clostridiales bacterium]